MTFETMFEDEGLMPVITEVRVTASAKAWAGSMAAVAGESSETEMSLAAVPTGEPGRKRAWTVAQSQKVALGLRRELQRLLLVDARVLGRQDPSGGDQALISYDVAIEAIGAEVEDNGSRETQ